MRIRKFFGWLLARFLVAAVAFMGVIFCITAVAHATSLRGASQRTDVMAPTPTTTTLTTSPASPAPKDAMVTLTATVNPANATGTVQFKDGTTDLGKPVMVAGGTATGTTSKLAVGSHQLGAVFIPSDAAVFSTSTATPVTFAITGPTMIEPTTTNTVLTTPAGSQVTQGSQVTLTATVTPTAAAGTVQFKDGTANLASPAKVSNGTAALTTSFTTAGARQLTAEFTPADSATYSPSTSPPLSLTVISSSQTVTPQAQQSGQSLDGGTNLDGQGVTVLDLDGRNGGRGVTLLDGGVSILDGRSGSGLTLLDLGGRNGGPGLTILRDRSGSGGLLSNLLHALL